MKNNKQTKATQSTYKRAKQAQARYFQGYGIKYNQKPRKLINNK